jgi:hypothetical protein
MAAQVVASRVVLSSTELVSFVCIALAFLKRPPPHSPAEDMFRNVGHKYRFT